jgi:hypothetical protein
MRSLAVLCLVLPLSLFAAEKKPVKAAGAPAPAAQNDDAYTATIRQNTTEPFFLTELVDHLPASATVPSPEKVLGYAIGTPDKLTYTKDINRYMRELEKASKRVKVFSIGRSEEGREMLLVAVSDEVNIARLDRYREITARLADPRQTPRAEADKLIAEGLPFYWASGAIHATETGSPEMLMELAYRLAVEETPFIQNIRRNSIALITPVTEVDGRDREVDVYNFRKANPGKPAPPLAYWGRYVMHDNNRDGIGMGLALTRNMTGAFLQFHPQVLHDLHESVPFLYVSTGMGPYNAWLDPIVVNEWQKMAWFDVEEMTKRGVPGVWTWGYYDGWAPNYMFYIANGHNSIGRFYETFGGSGADTSERTVPAASTSRAWYRPNPPLPRVKWSIRNNINLQQSGVLLSLSNVAENRRQFLENFYLKSLRAVQKAAKEGPAAYVIPAADPRPGQAAGLVNQLKLHGVEVHRLTADTEVEVTGDKKQKFAAGSYVVRMDQPYSRMADMLLDTQFYNPNDATPFDDAGWTLGALHNVGTVRVTKPEILRVAMTPVAGEARPEGRVSGAAGAAAYLINHNADNTLATFRFKLKDVRMSAAEEPFKAQDREFNAGTFIIKTEGNPADLRARLESAAAALGLTAYAAAELPKVAMHDVAAPRIAFVHTWSNTQAEGWFRIAFDQLQIPYDYISDRKLGEVADLRDRWDVIVLGPVGGTAQRIVNGTPMRGEPVPYQKSEALPNIGTSPDLTEDTRGGMGLAGVLNLAKFIDAGGLFVTITGNASIPIDYGIVEGIAIANPPELKARGSVMNSVVADKRSPIVYGYGEKLPVYFNQSPVFQMAAAGGGGRGGAAAGGAVAAIRPTGRGTATEADTVQGRPLEMASPRQPGAAGEDTTTQESGGRGGAPVPPDQRPRVVLRFAAENELLVSGTLAGGRALASSPAVVDVPRGKGHVVMFANNPMWRNQTQGSYFLLFNAMLHYDHLAVGVTVAPPAVAVPGRRGVE